LIRIAEALVLPLWVDIIEAVMRRSVHLMAAALLLGATPMAATAQQEVNFQRPVFTTQGTALCASQSQIAELRRALDDQDRATIQRIVAGPCTLVGPNIRLTVVAAPGTYDPDVEVRVGPTPGLDRTVPRGNAWTLKALLRN
jgi:hypothetical protein